MELELSPIAAIDPASPEPLVYGDVILDVPNLKGWRNEKILALKPFEFCTLAVLMRNAGRLISGIEIYYAAVDLYQALHKVNAAAFMVCGRTGGYILPGPSAKLLAGKFAANPAETVRDKIIGIRAALGLPGMITNHYGKRYKIELPTAPSQTLQDFPVLQHEDITVDLLNRRVTRADRNVALPDFQLCMLATLILNANTVLSREQIYENSSELYKTLNQNSATELEASSQFLLSSPLRVIAGHTATNISHVVRVQMGYLRKALGAPNVISTYPSEGYRMESAGKVIAPMSGLWTNPKRPTTYERNPRDPSPLVLRA